MTPPSGVTEKDLATIANFRENLAKLLKALNEIKDPETQKLISLGKESIAEGKSGIPLSTLWTNLGLK